MLLIIYYTFWNDNGITISIHKVIQNKPVKNIESFDIFGKKPNVTFGNYKYNALIYLFIYL